MSDSVRLCAEGIIVVQLGEESSYQTLHLLAEFIGVLAGQLKAVENSFKFDRVPMTLFGVAMKSD